jgi:hypothetical protein
MEVTLIKRTDGALYPYGETEVEKLRKVKAGRLVIANIRQPRNYEYHKRWFALAQFAYEIWVDGVSRLQYKGHDVQPNFERFRKDLIILAGYYDPVYAINGELRLEAHSISFGSMDQADFEALYSATINAVMAKILGGRGDWSEAKLRTHIDQLMSFDN